MHSDACLDVIFVVLYRTHWSTSPGSRLTHTHPEPIDSMCHSNVSDLRFLCQVTGWFAWRECCGVPGAATAGAVPHYVVRALGCWIRRGLSRCRTGTSRVRSTAECRDCCWRGRRSGWRSEWTISDVLWWGLCTPKTRLLLWSALPCSGRLKSRCKSGRRDSFHRHQSNRQRRHFWLFLC